MRSLGIIRQIDKNGRIVIPMEIRKQLNMKNDEDCFEIFTDADTVILKKYEPSCIFCGETEGIVSLGEHNVCTKCIDKLNDIKNSL